MSSLQPVRGTHDLLGAEGRRHRHVIDTARGIAGRYGFEGIDTPVFEFTEVFKRSIGEATDIVSKEMYSFTDRGDEHLTLRPEGTAGVVRATISNGLTQNLPLKFFYAGPMFRYERPQKGRMRQFHQIGVELLGVPGPQADVEVVALGAHILEELGLLSKTVLELNTLGDTASRQAYRAALVEFYRDHRAELSEDSLRRLEINPLRILDSKDAGDKRVNEEVPSFEAYLNAASQDFFGAVRDGLSSIGVRYELSPRLVRGLDYYCHTAFEFVTDALGAQGTVMGGGRYDGLMAMLGGPEIPGVGWAAGIERLALLLAADPASARPIALVPVGDAAAASALTLAQRLRHAGFTVDLGYSGNPAKRLKRANKIGARAALILGDEEITRGTIQLRDLDDGAQREVDLAALEGLLAPFR